MEGIQKLGSQNLSAEEFQEMREKVAAGKMTTEDLNNPRIPLAERNALAFDLARKLEDQVRELEERVGLDDLTQLLNKTFLSSILNSYIKGAPFKGKEGRTSQVEAVMVIVLDVKDFKKLNDTYGHVVGDKALLLIAKRLREATRPTDAVFRIGGDEFLVVMPISSKGDSQEGFERVRHEINSELFVEVEGEMVPIEISMGNEVVEKGDEVAVSRIIDSADKKMYDAKKTSRNVAE